MTHNVPGNGRDCLQCAALHRALDLNDYVNSIDFVRHMAHCDGPEQWAWSLALFIRAGA